MGCVLNLLSPQAQGDKLLSFALTIFDSFLLVVFLVFFSFYQRLSSKAVQIEFIVKSSVLQWIMWYF